MLGFRYFRKILRSEGLTKAVQKAISATPRCFGGEVAKNNLSSSADGEAVQMSCAATNAMGAGLLTDNDVGDILENYLLNSYPQNGPCKGRPPSPFSPTDALFGKDNGPVLTGPWQPVAKEAVGF